MKKLIFLPLLLAALGAAATDLLWNPAPGIVSYRLWSSTNAGPFSLLAVTATTNYPLGAIPPQSYGFYVTGITAGGGNTAPCTNLSLIVLTCQTNVPPPPVTNPPPPVLASTVYAELEQADLGAPMITVADASASGGFAVQSPTPYAGTVTASATLAAGVYVVWVRGKAVDGGHDSYFLAVDSSAEDIAGNEATLSPSYQWRRANGGNGGLIRTFNLAAGPHLFKFRCREATVPLDRMCVTKDSALVPQ
jgi:hypothetical protein